MQNFGQKNLLTFVFRPKPVETAATGEREHKAGGDDLEWMAGHQRPVPLESILQAVQCEALQVAQYSLAARPPNLGVLYRVAGILFGHSRRPVRPRSLEYQKRVGIIYRGTNKWDWMFRFLP